MCRKWDKEEAEIKMESLPLVPWMMAKSVYRRFDWFGLQAAEG